MNFTQPIKRDDPTIHAAQPGSPGRPPSPSDVTVDPTAEPIASQTADFTLNESEAQLYNNADTPARTHQGRVQGERYRLHREIARGGMGVILEARDHSLHRDVAMKVMINPREASKQKVARFIEEARITSQLQHPGIIPIHEMGVEKNGNVFYTMKRVTGKTLKDVLTDLKEHINEAEIEYPLNRLLTILQRVGDAVAYAHSKGVIHRDLKPENIMIGDYGEVLVLDWGLAKVLKKRAPGKNPEPGTQNGEDGNQAERSSEIGDPGTAFDIRNSEPDLKATMDGKAIGTPGYMAPEQARGQVAQMDETSDIYSLGAILYHILALEPPIQFDTARKRRELLDQISSGRIKPIKETRRAPGSLIAVAMKALSLQPRDRYPTVKAFQADLEAYLGGFATSAEDLSALKHFALFVQRHKVVSGSTAIILGLLATALSINIRERIKAEKAEKVAVAAGHRAESALLNLKATAPALVLLCESHLQHNEMDQALKIISNVTELAPENPEYHNKRGNILQTMYRFKEASEEYMTVLKLAPGNKNASENLEICREMEMEPQKLFLALRRQNRNDEAAHIVKSLTSNPQTLKTFVKSILDSENMVYKKIQFDNQGMGIVELEGVSDLSQWTLIPITRLSLLNSRRLSELSPLHGMPLTSLVIPGGDRILDLAPLAGMSLTNLYIEGGQFSNLSPLKDMPLISLSIRWNSLSDISPLKGLPLANLSFMGCRSLSDLSPLEGMALANLDLWGCISVSDLTPLKGLPLVSLSMSACKGIADLSPIKGMTSLTALNISQSRNISDLSPLSSLSLTSLHIDGCSKVTDLTPIKHLPLESLTIDEPLLAREKEIILGIKSLENINDLPAPEFWKRFNHEAQPVTR